MSFFASSPPQARLTLRVLAHLLRYPDAAFRAHTAELQQALRTEAALPAERLAELDALLRHLATQPALDIESEYVELFDRGRRTALHLFEHVHEDTPHLGQGLCARLGQHHALADTLEQCEAEQFLRFLLTSSSNTTCSVPNPNNSTTTSPRTTAHWTWWSGRI